MTSIAPSTPHTVDPPAAAARLALWRPRFAALRWVGGAYFLLLGASLLLLPPETLSWWLGVIWLRGAVSVASGLALLWLAATMPPRRVALPISILIAVPEFVFAFEYFRLSSFAASSILFLLALGVLLAPFGPTLRERAGWRPDALGLALGLAQAVQGVELLTRPGAAGTVPAQLGVPPPVVGAVFLVAGLAVALSQWLPGLPRLLRVAVHVIAGGAILGLWAAQAALINPLYWILGVAAVLRGAALLSLPWWSERATQFDGRSLRVRLALALVTVAVVPTLMVTPLILDHVEGEIDRLIPAHTGQTTASLIRVRQDTFAIAVLAGLAAGVTGWWLAGRLTAPLTNLMEGVGRIAAGEREVTLGHAGPTELARLSGAVETMAQALDAREEERAALIAQLQAQNEELRELQAARDENIRAISHDLRNPLTAISGNAQLLQRVLGKQGLSREERYATAIVRLSDRLNRMIQDMVESLRIEAGAVELRPERVNLAPCVQEVAERMIEPEQAPRLLVVPPPAPVSVMADPTRLDRILTNLFSNALKYSPVDRPVTVQMEPRGDMVVVAVRDEGEGLSEEEQARLFERYYRVDRTQTSTPGLGLGLYITRALVHAHGGTIWVESGIGKGSTFLFTLPRA